MKMKRKLYRILGVGLTLALLTSLLLTAAPVSALSVPSVTLDDAEISATATYTILFNIAKDVPDISGTITVAFPTGTDLTNVSAMTVSATSGIGSGPISAESLGTLTKSPSTTTGPTIKGTLPDITGETKIGMGAMVQVTVVGVKNPATVASYTLTVATSTEITAVESTSYSITAPVILPLPGVVERYNTANVLMEQTNSINTAIVNASDGDTILVGPGTYDEGLTIDIDKSLTLRGDAATTIIDDIDDGSGGAPDGNGGKVIISFDQTSAKAGVVFDGFTVKGDPDTANTALDIDGIGVTVKNCVFTKSGTATLNVVQTMVLVDPTSAATTYANTITDCSFDTTLGAHNDIGIKVTKDKLTVSGCTFTTDGTYAKDDLDRAVVLEGTALDVTVKDNTISGTGRKGIGADVGASGKATISGNTFDGLNQAIESDASLLTLTITDNVIKNSGCHTAEAVTSGTIDIGDCTEVTITDNTFIDNLGYVLEVGTSGGTGNVVDVLMLFNDMSGNAKMVLNNHSTATVDASHNFWTGDVVPTADATQITYLPVLAASSTGGTAVLGKLALTAKTTAGVDVTTTNAATVIAATRYAANPAAGAPPRPALANGYFDVYVAGTPGDITIKLYGEVTADTEAYVWSELGGTWAKCDTQSVNTFGGFVYVTVKTTTLPSIADLAGLPFVLVAGAAAAIDTPDILAPETGDNTVSLTPIFAWEQIPEAAGYYFELADNANFVTPLVKLDGDLGRLIVTAYAYVTELPYSTAYYWRVKAVSGTEAAGNLAESAWSTGVFVTMDEPEEPTPPVVIETTEPPVIEILPQPIIQPIVEVITPPATPITPAWIYVIIGVGAVLVIALIVLVVRTRRVA